MASYPPPPPPGYGPPGGYGPPPGGPYGYGYPPARTTNGKAIAALICGVASIFVCPLIAIAAVILGPQAKREIAAEPDRYDGLGLAQAGLIIGWIILGLTILIVVFAIVLIIIGAATSSSSVSLAALAA